jgi:mannan endo-1,4-beta-mannosidase
VVTELRLEAEDAVLDGLRTAAEMTGYSGTGYVTGFDAAGDRLVFRVDVPEGLYELVIGYASPHGQKGYDLVVGDERSGGVFGGEEQGFAEHPAGKYWLPAGGVDVVIERGWGHYHIDFIELRSTSVAPPDPVPADPVNPQATAAARRLLAYLASLYGTRVLSGQQELEEVEYVRRVTGKEPAILGFDLMDYSPSRVERGADAKRVVERVIAWHAKGPAIVTVSWHWNAPKDLVDREGSEWWRGFYTHGTTFNLKVALGDKNSEDHRLLLRDMDAIALELKKLGDVGMPVLWRPLHEASGAWFWWGAHGPDAFVELYRTMYDRFVRHHALHHLLWVYSPPEPAGGSDSFYPGDDVVDVVAVDVYADPTSTMSRPWEALQTLYRGRKLVALGETGTLPDPPKVARLETRWSYFVLWSGEFLHKLDPSVLRAVYGDESIVAREELPAFLALPKR